VAAQRVPPHRRAVVQLAPAPQRIAVARRFDLDHLRAELREEARRVRAGDQSAELDHFDAGERACAIFLRHPADIIEAGSGQPAARTATSCLRPAASGMRYVTFSHSSDPTPRL